MATDSIQLACESCGEVVSFPAGRAGQTDVCPECFEYIDLPQIEASPRPAGSLPSIANPACSALSFEHVDDLPRPQWDAFCQHVFDELPEPRWHDVFLEAARDWLETLAAALTGSYSTSESPNFFLLSALPADETERLLDFCEATRNTILSHLEGIAADAGYGKHVLLAFADVETYYTYVSHFHAEGESGGSGGMFLADGYQHIALHAARHWLYRTIGHELTHACLAHLPLPLWLNEGVTQEMEDVLLRQRTFEASIELTQRQKRYWREHSLESFWSGEAFRAADEGQELAYALARILVRNLTVDFREAFPEFVQTAEARDAGQAAAVNVFGLTLGQAAAQYLGEGAWDPQGESYAPDERSARRSRSRFAISASNPRSTGS